MTAEELKAVIEEVFDARARIDADKHGEHHAWVEEQIALMQERRELLLNIREWVVQWTVFGLLGALAGAFGSVVYFFRTGHWP